MAYINCLGMWIISIVIEINSCYSQPLMVYINCLGMWIISIVIEINSYYSQPLMVYINCLGMWIISIAMEINKIDWAHLKFLKNILKLLGCRQKRLGGRLHSSPTWVGTPKNLLTKNFKMFFRNFYRIYSYILHSLRYTSWKNNSSTYSLQHDN